MRIKQSEVFDKVSVTEICVFLTRRGTVTDFWFLWRVKKIFQEKNHTTFLGLPSGKNMKNFDFSSYAKYFRYGSVLVDIPS